VHEQLAVVMRTLITGGSQLGQHGILLPQLLLSHFQLFQ
jgi:hypothetical protein